MKTKPVAPAAITPMAPPLFSLGVSVAIRALELEMKAAKTPWTIRSPISYQTLVTNPIAPKTIAIPRAARRHIGLRP